RFEYRPFINGREVKRDTPYSFRTQALWHWRTDPPAFSFVFGSCAYTTDTPTDRPGNPYGGNYEIFGEIVKAKPDFMVWLGDNVYYREVDWTTESGMRRRFRFDHSQPYYQEMWANFPHYATWDDHDFGPNNSDRTFRLRAEALKVFNDYFPSLVRGTDEAKGTFFRFEWNDVEFFMLDNRYHRTPNRLDGTPGAQKLGPVQLTWLKESLASSLATFKVIVSGGQMINPMIMFEAFGDFPTEQKDLFDFIAGNDIRGVVFLSGDRHAGELLKVRWPGASYDWYEFTSSPLTAGAGRIEAEADNPARVPGTWITRTRNFGRIQVEGPRNDRTMIMQAIDSSGKTLWEHRLRAQDLRRPQN
ncbi:MAG: alkaline phosphatase family protein, partial [Fimbriimonadaceae bacterium]|nr:alkaline phosphatase family protein [Fimbriimonadaceae bacterium]